MKKRSSLSRRSFLGGVGLIGLTGGAAVLHTTQTPTSAQEPTHPTNQHSGQTGDHVGLMANMVMGDVDTKRNNFDPLALLTDFDYGTVTKLPDGRTLRDYQLIAGDQLIEIAPGVMFPAWSYNGRVPGPTLRCTEGDRLRITFINGSSHPHSIHFHWDSSGQYGWA